MALHPKGVNHLAISTNDMKGQLEFFCDVLGLPLKALYWMHGVAGTYHGFVELAPDSYIAFVQHPQEPRHDEVQISGIRIPARVAMSLHVRPFVIEIE